MKFFKNPLVMYTDFRCLYFGKLIAMLCDRYFVITVSWWILHSGIKNSNSLIGLIMGTAMIAEILGGPFMGVAADRYSKKKCLIVAVSIPLIIITALFCSFSLVEQYPLSLIGFYFLMSLFMPLIMSASASALSSVVPEGELAKAVALDGSITFIGPAIGSTLSGIIVMYFGITSAFSFQAAFYLLAIICFRQIKTIAENSLTAAENVKNNNMVNDIKEGLCYFLHNRFLLALVAIFCLVNFFMTPIMMAIPIITTDILKGTALHMSLLELSLSLGAIITSAVLGTVNLSLSVRKVLTIDLFISGLIFLLISRLSSFYLLSVCLFIVGAGIGITNASVMTKVQEVIPEELKGRIFALATMSVMAITPLAFVLTGFISDLYGIMTVLFFNGTAFLLVSLFSYILLKENKDITLKG